MGKVFKEITPEIADWVQRQRIFFVSTAPLAAEGLLNCSPKGMDTFRILGPDEVAYLDLTGSGIETAAHLSENARIVFMFCAFSGPPKIVRFHGVGVYHLAGSAAFERVAASFPSLPGVRGMVRVQVTRISDSCGYSVPKYEFVEERDTLVRWAEAKGEPALQDYRAAKNERSIDGLPGLPGAVPPGNHRQTSGEP